MTVEVEIRRRIPDRDGSETHRYGENVIDGGTPVDCRDIFSTNGTIVALSYGTRYLPSRASGKR